jgi:hypothetical protein
MDRIVSMYWNNIDRRVVAAQRRVFAHFGFEIEQCERTKTEHGDFLDEYMSQLAEDDVALFTDIDCFPLNRDIVLRALTAAREGRIFGVSQLGTHVGANPFFAAPAFLAISRRTWDRIGRPSFRRDATDDVAERLNAVARAAAVPIDMLFPWTCVVPKWQQWQGGDEAMYGIGTFYKGGVFHLFQARQTPYKFILYDVADAVIENRSIDHIALARKALPFHKYERMAEGWSRWRDATKKYRRAWVRFRDTLLRRLPHRPPTGARG